MTLGPKIDLDGSGGEYLIPFAKHQLAHFKAIFKFGKRHWELPTGEQVTIWWGFVRDKIKITAQVGFEFLSLENDIVALITNLVGIKFDPATNQYSKEVNAKISSPPGPDDVHLPANTRDVWMAEGLGHKVVLAAITSGDNAVHYYTTGQKTGPDLDTLSRVCAGGSVQPIRAKRLVLTDGTIMSLVSAQTSDAIWPKFDFAAFTARANTAWPSPDWEASFVSSFSGPPAFTIQGLSGGAQELIIWTRFETPFHTSGQLSERAMYMERYRLDAALVPIGSPAGVGLTLVETVNVQEPFLVFRTTPGGSDPGQSAAVVPGPQGTVTYSTSDLDNPAVFYNGNVAFFPYNSGASNLNAPGVPSVVNLNFPGGSSIIHNDGLVAGGGYPYLPFVHPVDVEQDVYWFLNATANKPGFSPTGSTFDGKDVYQPTGQFTITYQRMVAFNGAPGAVSEIVRVYDNNSSTWDDTTPVDIYVPIVGHRVTRGDLFLGWRVRQTFVPLSEMPLNGFNRVLPFTILPAVFNADLSEVHVYDVPFVGGPTGQVYIGTYKGELFYVFSALGPSTGFHQSPLGVPVNAPDSLPVSLLSAGTRFEADASYSPARVPAV